MRVMVVVGPDVAVTMVMAKQVEQNAPAGTEVTSRAAAGLCTFVGPG